MPPFTLEANLKFRQTLIRAAREGEAVRQGIRNRCAQDLLFWIAAYGWIYEPRSKSKMPWVPWDYQVEALKILQMHAGNKWIGCEKSRDMGATWMFLALTVWAWTFHSNGTYMVASRNEREVDARGLPNTLFWKMNFLISSMPPFLQPKNWLRQELTLLNYSENNVITGASTTKQMGRGGRSTWIFLDEFSAYEPELSEQVISSMHANTNSILMNSTYQGTVGAFYRQMQRTDTNFIKISLPWVKHPNKTVGAEPMDPQAPEPKNSWGLTSPWYRRTWDEIAIRSKFSQEVNMDASGSVSRFFEEELLREHRKHVRPPFWQGRLVYDAYDIRKARLEECPGDIKLWTKLINNRPVPGDEYCFGADVSRGRGTTPSILSGANKRTREKVLEIARSDLDPDQFATMAVAICHLFFGAYLIWEQNGPGLEFGKTVLRLGYYNFYVDQHEYHFSKKQTKVPGWLSNRSNKDLLLTDYLRCLRDDSFINRSDLALKECEHYQFFPDGSIESDRRIAIDDPSGAKENHGDRVIADALCCKGLGAEKIPGKEAPQEPDPFAVYEEDPQEHSFQWLLKQWKAEQKQNQWNQNESRHTWRQGTW